MPGDTNGCTTVGDTRAESADVSSLVATRQPQIVVLSVHRDMFVVLLRQFFDSGLDVRHASGFTHSLGAVVGVATGTVPVSLERFGVKGDDDTPLLSDTSEEETGHPEMVTHGDTLTRANLELPLRRHDFCVDTADVDTSVEASTVMSLN